MAVPTLALQLGVLAALALSLLVVRRLDRPEGTWGVRLRSRLLLGVPWGTLVVVALVASVYLFVQGGYRTPYAPLHIPFTSWSYRYPLGLVTAPFAHQSLGHVTGNLLGTVVLAPLAEYAFSHFPTRRGQHAFGTWRSNPYVRAFVLFPAGVVAVGLLTSLFAWGPIIGFSGVVFAFAGFSLVRFPMATVVALAARDLVGTLYSVLQDPIITGSAGPSFGSPWWAGIAIQGHLLGFLLGAVLAAGLLYARDERERPSALRLWAGALVVGSNMTLWAVWWYRAGGGYVLYRGPGLAMVVAVAGLLAIAVVASERPLVPGITRRQVGLALLALPVLTMGFVAVPLNATTVQDGAAPAQAIAVEGYHVTYAEDVPNQRVGAIDVSAFGATTQINASGVIVVDPDRSIWTEAVSSSRLAYAGTRTVQVGGLGERASVTALRQGWTAVGGGTAYQVAIETEDGTRTWVFASSPVRAEPTIDGQSVSIRPDGGQFFVTVRSPVAGRETARLPAPGESVRLGTLTLTNRDGRLVAASGRTHVRVATEESYR